MVATDHAVPRRASARRPTGGAWMVGLLAAVTTISVPPLSIAAAFFSGLPPPRTLPWWVLAVGFAVAEFAVVHLKFRRDAHSFSVSEIPLVVGLFFATVPDLVLGMAAGSAIALVLVRRQRGVKLVFNLAQFTVQAAIAALVFNVVTRGATGATPIAWLAAVAATLAAFLVANALVTTAIRATGGRLSWRDLREVLVFGVVGTLINTSLALVGVTLAWYRPSAAWLAVIPVVVLFMAYRAYTEQRDERARVQALYDFTLALHGAPTIDDALPLAAQEVCRMFEVETVHLVLVADGEQYSGYRTVARTDGSSEPLEPVSIHPRLRDLINADRAKVNTLDPDTAHRLDLPGARSIMSAPIHADGVRAGVILLGDPLSSVGEFTGQDRKVLETIAGRIALSVENGALQASLREVTKLTEELEEVVRSKDRFIATVSHELRNPLTGVIGLAQTLREARELLSDEEIDEMLEMIHDGSSELGNIVEDLLVAAREDLETLVIKARDFGLLEEMQSLLLTVPGQVDSHVHVADPNTAPAVYADPLRVRQIVRNLLSNAARYGGDTVRCEIDTRGGMAILAVADDGSGVPTGSEERIFEPYGTAEGTDHVASVGLGLAVSRQLARRMGGELDYRRVDGWTRFELTLPLA